jgi:hypothetical protein
LSLICSPAWRKPATVGLKVIDTLHVALTATEAPLQVLVANAKSPALTPLNAAVVIVKVALPVFVTVKVIGALVTFNAVFGNVTGPVGVIVTAGPAGAVPMPVSVALCGLPFALSAACRVAVRVPVPPGVNVTATVQVAFAANPAPSQVFAESAKSPAFVPVTVNVVMFKAALPLFVIVTVTGVLATPCTVLGNMIGLVGVIVTAGEEAASPLPVSARVCGLPSAASAISRFASRAPVPLGLNVTPTVQVPFTASVAFVQVLVGAVKSVGFVPVSDTPVMSSEAPLLFVTVIEIGVLVVSTVVSGKLIGPVGVNVTADAGGAIVHVKIFCVAVMPPDAPVNPA